MCRGRGSEPIKTNVNKINTSDASFKQIWTSFHYIRPQAVVCMAIMGDGRTLLSRGVADISGYV